MKCDFRKETAILTRLRENARRQLKEISIITGLPISTIHEKLKAFKGRYIKKFTCMLNYENLGFPVRVKFLLKAKKDEKNTLGEFLHSKSQINSVFKINNDFDYLADGIFKSMHEVEAFTEEIEKRDLVSKKQIYYVMEVIKEEEFFTNEHC